MAGPLAYCCFITSWKSQSLIQVGIRTCFLFQVFNIRARKLRLTLEGHKEAANVGRFSGDGK